MPTLTDIGRIGRDVELRFTPNDDPVCNLAIACEYGRKGQDGKRTTQWVDAALWGKQAEAMTPYVLKGQQVHFTIDDAHVETYTKGDGSQAALPSRASRAPTSRTTTALTTIFPSRRCIVSPGRSHGRHNLPASVKYATATSTGQPWGVYRGNKRLLVVMPSGLTKKTPIEVCHP